MRNYFARIALIASMLCMAACGFEPLQSQAYRASLAVDLSSLVIDVNGLRNSSDSNNGVGRRYSELLKAEIQDQINPTTARGEKLFKVVISYNEQQAGLFVNPDGTASRGDLIYTSNYAITRILDGKAVASGNLNRTSSYNTSPTADYASYVSIEDARERGILELAQDYKLRLAALLPTLNDPNATVLEKKSDEALPVLQPVRINEALTPGY